MMRNFFKAVFVVVAVLSWIFLIGYTVASIGHCTILEPYPPHPSCQVEKVKGHPRLPDNQLCESRLDKVRCDRCQKILNDYGHSNLRVLEGSLIGTAANIRRKTFIIVLKCVATNGNVYAVGLIFKKNNMTGIKIKVTDERQWPS